MARATRFATSAMVTSVVSPVLGPAMAISRAGARSWFPSRLGRGICP
jgi:hypothetical protein